MSDSDDDNFVTFGEPLEPLDEENLPRKKPVTIEDQVATDAQGRRRFHGAFTGGFSAGYFNTVGTRDGWRPQQFKSSRGNKAGSVNQLPEDFMDEEDIGEFGIAPTGIRASSAYTDYTKGTKRERHRANNDGPIPGVPVLKDILKPVSDTVGVSLLKKMGWKPGQGVGPRITRREKKKTHERNEKKKVYGCSLPTHDSKSLESPSESSDSEEEGILFAPDDYEPFRCNPKDNYFGIGYSGLDRKPILGHVNLFDTPTFQLQEKNKKLSIRGQAFGVGAFEGEDEDIYAREDMSSYDFTLGPELTTKKRSSIDSQSSQLRNCIEGFVPAKSVLQAKKNFPPPELPKNFKPLHKVRKSRFSPAEPELHNSSKEVANRKGLARHELNANDRSIVLGEAVSQKIVKDETVAKSPAVNIIARTLNLHGRDQVVEREKLALNAKKSTSWLDKLTITNFVKGGTEGADGTGSLKNLSQFQSALKSDINLGMSKPFAMDDDKQKRFDKYLEFANADEKNKLSGIQPLSMTDWEREREKEEFEQAARLSDRKIVSTNDGQSVESADPIVNAARSKMFGKLTRTIDLWQPVSIVCKRFNIPEPKSGCAKPDQKTKKYSVFESLDFCGGDSKFQKATDTKETYKEPDIPWNPESSQSDQATTSTGALDTSDIDTRSSKSVEKIRNFEVSYENVFGKSCVDTVQSGESQKGKGVEVSDKSEKQDLFKAIFLSSSEDEGSDEEDVINSDAVKSVLIGKSIGGANVSANVERNNSPPRGIFAKLDLDELMKPSGNSSGRKITKDCKDEPSKSTDLIEGDNDVEVSGESKIVESVAFEMKIETYGPALPVKPRIVDSGNPEIVQRPVFRSVVIPKLDGGDKSLKWIEKKKSKRDKKKKHKHKEKEREREKEKKHKHKSKKSKR